MIKPVFGQAALFTWGTFRPMSSDRTIRTWTITIQDIWFDHNT